jgi:hypothetical protein
MQLQRPFVCITSTLLLIATFAPQFGTAQTPAPDNPDNKAAQDPALAETVKQLQEQVKELRSIVSDLRTESEQYRVETRELREELHSVAAQLPQRPSTGEAVRGAGQAVTAQAGNAADSSTSRQESDPAARATKLEEEYDLLTGKIDDQYQTKVESGSKYKIRLSGLVLMDLFSNRGGILNADLPGVVDGPDPLGRSNSTGFSLRQSQIGLEVFGPQVAGARTRGELQADFAGGFPAAPNGAVFGLLRLRTGTIHLDWAHTSVVAGQDAPFFSALSPTSFATIAEPALAYAGNLWTWVPQVRVEHRMTLSENSSFILQAGILDGLTGEPPLYSYGRAPQAGEYSRQPGYAGRVAWSYNLFGQPMTLGAGGYYSRQNWGFGRNINGWASTLDWTAPLGKWLSLSGEFYRGQALGGLGGGSYRSALFSWNPTDPTSRVRALETIGGWSQLKVRASSKLEFNAAAGQDNPFAGEIRAFPFSAYGGGSATAAVARNQSELLNVIYRLRSDLVFSAEYGHISTYQIDNSKYTADRVNLVMGILF